MTNVALVALAASLLVADVANSFYLPGVAPRNFGVGEVVPLKVNSLTSTKTMEGKDTYKYAFCKPYNEAGEVNIVTDPENLGEWLTGDDIQNSPYLLQMKTDSYCMQLCTQYLGRSKKGGIPTLIKNEYHHNWIVDNIPSAMRMENSEVIETLYLNDGFPVGFTDKKSGVKYINNHVNINILYHPVEGETAKYRVVQFIVEPFSINHKFDLKEGKKDIKWNPAKSQDPVTITNSNVLTSCNPETPNVHTTWDMAQDSAVGPQVASGVVLFTYDVTWTESDIHWASRWDIYLNMENGIPDNIHWYQILNSLLITVLLSAMIAWILARNLKRDLLRYNAVPTDEEKAEDREEFGWKLIHGDVFRPPSQHPMLLAVVCGTGMQVLAMSLATIVFSAVGFMSPAFRGSLIMGMLMFYCLCGSIAGYVTARLYKSFKGKMWQRATVATALLYPGMFFGLFFLLNLVNWANASTDAVPFTSMVVVVILWFGISVPLVFLGSYFGYKKDAIEYPTATANIPRQIPEQSWFMNAGFVMIIGGILPFGAMFVELFLIMQSIWAELYYYVFGFLFIVWLILLVTAAEISILFTYFQLCAENHNWWWRSFLTSGAVAQYVFFYSILYFQKMKVSGFAAYCLYFGYMGSLSVGLWLMTGAVGTLACLKFNILIYGSIKVD
jgi:transmembrane 9 superfamily protein 2/4